MEDVRTNKRVPDGNVMTVKVVSDVDGDPLGVEGVRGLHGG